MNEIRPRALGKMYGVGNMGCQPECGIARIDSFCDFNNWPGQECREAGISGLPTLRMLAFKNFLGNAN